MRFPPPSTATDPFNLAAPLPLAAHLIALIALIAAGGPLDCLSDRAALWIARHSHSQPAPLPPIAPPPRSLSFTVPSYSHSQSPLTLTHRPPCLSFTAPSLSFTVLPFL